MMETETESIRAALQQAKEDLLEGRVPGPLTSTRLVEIAGVKRHRLTHDNPDINDEFQSRARALNRTKPEVDRLRANLDAERERNTRLVTERDTLDRRLKAYSTALLGLLEERDKLFEERDQLLEALSAASNVTALPNR
jgi:septal ring factor EnvC (AmiA/AmiB activator)